MSLEKLRQAVAECNRGLTELFQKRQSLVLEIARYKKEKKLPIYDGEREKETLKSFPNEAHEFLRQIMRLSRKQQSELLFPYNIILTGFMGTGKTAVGARLAFELGRDFYDTDGLLEKRLGTTIAGYFQEKGEPAFRQREKELLREIAKKEKVVISLGGGAVLDGENVTALRANGRFILLKAAPETILARLKSSDLRPLLGQEMTAEKINELQNKRRDIYLNCADVVVETDNLTIEEAAVEAILALYGLKERGKQADETFYGR
ncbi:MAG TPA: hypothetical protein GX528_03585 [Firmicutes bacterium]|nr:hypothetical protein [Bacillota bacterium]